jgi:hypothetical protein
VFIACYYVQASRHVTGGCYQIDTIAINFLEFWCHQHHMKVANVYSCVRIFKGNQLHGLTTAIIVVFIATATTTLILTWNLTASSASSEVFTQLLGSTVPTEEAKSRWLIFCKWLNFQATNRLKQTLITSLLLHYKRCHWPTQFL